MKRSSVCCATLLVLLTGCGDQNPDQPVVTTPPAPLRGSVVGTPAVKLVLPAAALQTQVVTSLPATTLALVGALKCDLVVLHVLYVTDRAGGANH